MQSSSPKGKLDQKDLEYAKIVLGLLKKFSITQLMVEKSQHLEIN